MQSPGFEMFPKYLRNKSVMRGFKEESNKSDKFEAVPFEDLQVEVKDVRESINNFFAKSTTKP